MAKKNYHDKERLHIGRLIKARRKAREEKEDTVAKAVGIDHGTLSKIENGKYISLKINTTIDLFEYLGIPLSELPPPRAVAF